MTALAVTFIAGTITGAAIYHRILACRQERAYYDRQHLEDFDRLLDRCDTAENAFGRALTLLRKTRRRVAS